MLQTVFRTWIGCSSVSIFFWCFFGGCGDFQWIFWKFWVFWCLKGQQKNDSNLSWIFQGLLCIFLEWLPSLDKTESGSGKSIKKLYQGSPNHVSNSKKTVNVPDILRVLPTNFNHEMFVELAPKKHDFWQFFSLHSKVEFGLATPEL
jgi:hypothetical protein